VNRDLHLDFFRGLFLVVMTLNHWPGKPIRIFDQPLGLVSAAEGFVFVSGLTAGLVYGRMAERRGPLHLRSRAFRRAREIYQTHVFFLAVIFALGLAFQAAGTLPASWAERIPFLLEEPLRGLAYGALLVFQPKYFNILPLYILLLMLTPAVLGAFRRGRAVPVLAASGLVWCLAQLEVGEAAYAWLTRDIGHPVGMYFDPLGWQFLFVLGLWLGHARHAGTLRRPEGAWWTVACLAAALVLAWYRHQIRAEIYPIDQILGVDMANWTSREKLGPVRLLNFFVLLQLTVTLVARYPTAFTGRWFRFLGRHSLQVFSFHLLLIYLAAAVRDWGPPTASSGIVVWWALLGAVSLTFPAYLSTKIGRRPFEDPRRWLKR
jgi:hypothetical protein